MINVMLIKNHDKAEIVTSPKDFEELIYETMGSDAANYYHDQIMELTKYIEDELLPYFIDDAFTQQDAEGILKDYGFQ